MAHLPAKVQITEVDVLGYSLGGANAAVVKSIDAAEHGLNIHRAVMINPPVSLFASMDRLDRLFAQSIGPGAGGRRSASTGDCTCGWRTFTAPASSCAIEDTDLLRRAAAVLRTDADFSAAIALTFRLALMNVFYDGRPVCRHRCGHRPAPSAAAGRPDRGGSAQNAARQARSPSTSTRCSRRTTWRTALARPATRWSPSNRLDIIGDALRNDPDYYAQTNADDLILDRRTRWLRTTLGSRIAVYDHGGHLGNLGERQQIADMLRDAGRPLAAGRASDTGRAGRRCAALLCGGAAAAAAPRATFRVRQPAAETPAADNAVGYPARCRQHAGGARRRPQRPSPSTARARR